jgi:hypothetical protein
MAVIRRENKKGGTPLPRSVQDGRNSWPKYIVAP